MNSYIVKHQESVTKAIEHFKDECNGLRTGRANPNMVEKILVESYGSKMPLNQLASISIPEPRVIRIEPWDKSITKAIEIAINESDMGVKASVDGNVVRINIPMMTEENRQDLVKLLRERLEESKIALRSIRENIREEIISAEKNKELTEDDKFDYLKELDKEIEGWNKTVQDIAEAKDKEIMTV